MKKTRSLKLVSLFLVVLFGALALLACAPQQPTTPTTPTSPTSPTTPTTPQAPVTKIVWRANSITAPSHLSNADEYWGVAVRKILQETGGRLEIQAHWNNELGFGHRDYPKLLKEGLVEISDLPMLMGDLYIPAFSYESIPLHLGLEFPKELTKAVHEGRRPYFVEELAKWNGKLLASFYHQSAVDAPSEMSSTVAFNTLADMKGTTRRESNPTTAAFWANFGVKSIIIGMPEVYMGYKTGMFESSNLGRSSYKDYKLYEVAKYLVVYNQARPSLTTYGWAASTLHWDKLPPDIQNVMVNAFKDMQEAKLRDSSDPNFITPEETDVNKWIKDFNINIITWSPEDQATVQSVADRSMAEWLAKTDELGRNLYKSDMQALGRPERYDQLLEQGKQLLGM